MNPVQVDDLATPGDATAVVVHDDHAYVADGAAGLHVFDITDPTAVWLKTTIPLPHFALDLVVAGELLYVAMEELGFTVVDISDPAHPLLVGGATSTSGVTAVTAPDPGLRTVVSLRAYPNPVARDTVFRLAIPIAGNLEVSVYDVAGRLVRGLYRGQVSAGVQRIGWDARDRQDALVAAGVYYVRAVTPTEVVSGRVVVVRQSAQPTQRRSASRQPGSIAAGHSSAMMSSAFQTGIAPR